VYLWDNSTAGFMDSCAQNDVLCVRSSFDVCYENQIMRDNDNNYFSGLTQYDYLYNRFNYNPDKNVSQFFNNTMPEVIK